MTFNRFSISTFIFDRAMKTYLPLLALALSPLAAHSDDLFINRKPIEFQKYQPLPQDATIGGYAIYRGGQKWVLKDLSNGDSGSHESADRIDFGRALLIAGTPEGKWMATMGITVNLSGASHFQWFTGNPCAGTHTATLNKSVGVWDNCLTIDVRDSQSNGKTFSYLEVVSTQSQSGGRSYRLYLGINLEELGFPGTSAVDWSESAIGKNGRKKDFIQRTMQWAERLQNGTNAALAFSKPQGVFDDVPPLGSLVAQEAAQASLVSQ